MYRSLYTAGLASVVAASFGEPQAAEALNNAGLSLALVGMYVHAFEYLEPGTRKSSTPEPGQRSYYRRRADGSYDEIIWPYGYSVVEDQFMSRGNRVPPDARDPGAE